MGACTVAPTPSSHDLRPTSNSVSELPGAKRSLNSEWPAGSPDESNTETKQPHDTFFMKRRALFTSLWKIWVATTLFPANKKLMGNEERRLTCRQTRCVNNTLCQSLQWQVRTCQRISKSPALRLRTTHCRNIAHDVDKTIIVISFSLKMTCSTLLASNRSQKFSSSLLAFSHNHRQPGKTQTNGAKLTVDVVSSIFNSPSADLDTPSVKRAATVPSELAIQISCKAWLMSSYMVVLHLYS